VAAEAKTFYTAMNLQYNVLKPPQYQSMHKHFPDGITSIIQTTKISVCFKRRTPQQPHKLAFKYKCKAADCKEVCTPNCITYAEPLIFHSLLATEWHLVTNTQFANNYIMQYRAEDNDWYVRKID
jgi:hypothetical protein